MSLQTHAIKNEPMDLGTAQTLLQSADVKWYIPTIFVNALQLDSISTVFVDLGGRPLAGVRMTLPLAKSYVTALSHAIDDYEKKTGHTIPTLDELQARLRADESAKG